MIPPDAQVIGHRSPLPRIDLHPVWPRLSPAEAAELAREEMWQFQRWAEGDRIWRLIVEAAR
jgi:hypothetical protein